MAFLRGMTYSHATGGGWHGPRLRGHVLCARVFCGTGFQPVQPHTFRSANQTPHASSAPKYDRISDIVRLRTVLIHVDAIAQPA